MIDRIGPLSIVQQCTFLKISRSSLYYSPREETYENQDLMQKIEAPLRRLMQLMGVEGDLIKPLKQT